MFNVSQKKILITGGSSGIGEALAKGFSDANAIVTIIDIQNPIKSNNIDFIKCDLSKLKSIDLALNKYKKKYFCPDVIINCAGVAISKESHNYSQIDWQKTIDINLSAIFYICKQIGKIMIKSKIKGSIINITSIGAEQGFPNNPAYQASKGAVKQLTKAMAVDWGQYGIRVNNIVPGYTNTPMNKKSWNNKKLRKARSDNTLLKRWANPNEMVGPSIFLASDASSYITGIDLIVDGGWLAKGI
ncbi:MAG: 2-deoxy-D-gluconate 3-dehydrogenase [Gammaproteobacteria bacterium]|nr:2-deoxy-D-gluconate 3-dehydrogenase [Gammaproteobacteria bacterium]